MSGQEYVRAARNPMILIDPWSARTFDHDDFSALVSHLTQATGIMADTVQVRQGYNYGGPLPEDWVWITFILDEALAATVGSIVTAVTAWGGHWLRKTMHSRRQGSAAGLKATIYGPNGETLAVVEVPPSKERE